MVKLDEKLLRKRSEHNEGLLYELEEISLHQEEIERIENIGNLCKHVKILLLQNNIISKIENLNKLKELEYLNLALNNISKIEKLDRCESLKKLDLTVNFIDFDEFESSLVSLQGNYNLEDLYLVGNPVQSSWAPQKYRMYVIGQLPQLKQLDGTLISSVERIAARSHLHALAAEVESLASTIRQAKAFGRYESSSAGAYTRQSRVDMYREVGAQKAAQQKAENQRLGIQEPKPPKPVTSVFNSRGEVRQCNEGGYEYKLDEWSIPNEVFFELAVPRFMDSSLIEVDVNPTFIRCVVNGKLTQLRLDNEVNAGRSKVTRSKTTGKLVCHCPFENPRPVPQSSPPLPHVILGEDAPPPLEIISS